MRFIGGGLGSFVLWWIGGLVIWLQQCIATLDIPLLYICGFNPIPGASNRRKI